MSNLNVSTISTNSQMGDYSRIGFERTASVHFDDLKSEQVNVRSKVTEVRKEFGSLKLREKAWEKKKEAMAREMEEKEKKGLEGMEVSSLWTCSDDYIDEEMAIETAMINFNQARQDAINMTKEWEQASSNQIAIYPGFDKEGRKKRALDFSNLMRKNIAKTTPMGDEEEEEEEKEWLKTKTRLPEEHPDLRGYNLRDRTKCSVNKGKSLQSSTSATTSFPLTSTPENARQKKTKGEEKAPKSNLGSLVESTAEATDSTAKPASDEDEKEDDFGCPVEATTGNKDHVCVELKKGMSEEKDGEDEVDTDDEPEGPDYERGGHVKEEKESNESIHKSIIQKSLGRPISEGLADTSAYMKYEGALEEMQRLKLQADEEVRKAKEVEKQWLQEEKEEEEKREKEKMEKAKLREEEHRIRNYPT